MILCECGCGRPTSIATQTRRSLGHVKGNPVRFIRGHALKRKPGIINYNHNVNERGCWLWLGTLDEDGYGQCSVDGKTTHVYKYNYEQKYGQVPRGKQLDHTCRNRRCVNPDHLEVVTPAVNTQRAARNKLNASTVQEIRVLRSGGVPLSVLAAEFNVSEGHISEVANLKTWRNV